jgi:hypothetical protein
METTLELTNSDRMPVKSYSIPVVVDRDVAEIAIRRTTSGLRTELDPQEAAEEAQKLQEKKNEVYDIRGQWYG